MQEALMSRHGWFAGLACAVCVGLGGCVGWSSYPAEPGSRLGADPNEMHMTDVMVASLNWVVRKYPVVDEAAEPSRDGTVARGPFTVNLPAPLKPLIHKRTVSRINGAVPLTPATQELPTYHIVSVRVRGDAAQVNVLRPMTTMDEKQRLIARCLDRGTKIALPHDPTTGILGIGGSLERPEVLERWEPAVD